MPAREVRAIKALSAADMQALLSGQGMGLAKAVDSQILQHLTIQLAQLQGDLRLAHLQAHVEMKRVLSREQIDTYGALRGYTVGTNPALHTEHQRHQH